MTRMNTDTIGRSEAVAHAEVDKDGFAQVQFRCAPAKVVAVGPGQVTKDGKTLPMPVQVGDLILMDKYGSQEVTIDDEDYVIVKADDIIAIVN